MVVHLQNVSNVLYETGYGFSRYFVCSFLLSPRAGGVPPDGPFAIPGHPSEMIGCTQVQYMTKKVQGNETLILPQETTRLCFFWGKTCEIIIASKVDIERIF